MDGFVFDMDGILLDTEKMFMECWEIVADEFGLDKNLIRQTALDCVGLSAVETDALVRERFGSIVTFEELSKRIREVFKKRAAVEGIPIKPGVFMLLEYLKTNRIPVALASSTKYHTVVEELTDAKLIQYFRVIVGGDQVERGKPAPDVYVKACREMNFNPANTIAVEDSVNGLKAAKAAGMKTIMIPDLLPYTDDLQPYVDEHFNSLSDVLDALIKDNLDI